MPPQKTLRDITEDLNSDKPKKRQEGIQALRSTLSREQAFDSVDTDSDGVRRPDAWKWVVQALNSALLKEREACLKKNHSHAAFAENNLYVRRLTEVASTIRWLTEKAVDRWNWKTTQLVLDELLSNIRYRQQLVAPIALDLAKAIKCIVGWKPHLEHMDDETWMKLTELSFNVILADPLNTQLASEDLGDVQTREASLAPSVTTAGDSEQPSDDNGEAHFAASSKKRRRPERATTPRVPTAGPSRLKESQPVKSEQIEFTAVLSLLLQSQTSPILSATYRSRRSPIFTRLSRFLVRYPNDSSLHRDYIRSLSAMLSHFASNERALVIHFARQSWHNLLGIWGTKAPGMKEDLLIVLRILFPYFTADIDNESDLVQRDICDGVNRLWHVLYQEAERRGVEGLHMESLRLQVIPLEEGQGTRSAFVADTFRFGWHFDANQALAWASFELQADSAAKLYRITESIHTTSGDGKRQKWNNPIHMLLDAIDIQSTPNTRCYHLQSLLFFVDRHWSLLHTDLQKVVVEKLQVCFGLEDPLTQSWSLLCIAAIALAQGRMLSSPTYVPPTQSLHMETIPWDSIFQQVVRRTTSTTISRAACHAAHTLLMHSKSLLSPHKVPSELETFAKELNIQGPSYPYDSVCEFLVSCMRVASHDVRLYRMQLEEKVLSWFVDTWRPSGLSKSRMAPCCVADINKLLTTVCGITEQAELISAHQLPACSVVDAVIAEHRQSVIRDFLLFARLPPKQISKRGTTAASMDNTTADFTSHRNTGLAEPNGRERRISSYFLKALEDLNSSWDKIGSSVEKTRTHLDLCILAMCYEGTLVANGVQSNRRVLQAASRLFASVVPSMSDHRWTIEERHLIVSAIEPLILGEWPSNNPAPWETLIEPGPRTGIRREVLLQVQSAARDSKPKKALIARRTLQRIVLQNPEVHNCIGTVLHHLRKVLTVMLEPVTSHQLTDLDGRGLSFPKSSAGLDVTETGVSFRHVIVDLCVTSLAVFPALQSIAGEPTRDKELLELVASTDEESILVIAPSFFENVKQGTLQLKASSLKAVLEQIGDILPQYQYARHPPIQLLAIHVLDCTMQVWCQQNADVELVEYVQHILAWLLKVNTKPASRRSWLCRERLVRFIARYVVVDPEQVVWPAPELPADWNKEVDIAKKEEENEDESMDVDNEDVPDVVAVYPVDWAAAMLKDNDIRVRFRLAVEIPRFFDVPGLIGDNTLETYTRYLLMMEREVAEYEHMMTRLIFLGNMMIISSAVRRGTYWHLLETSLLTHEYNKHMETVLEGVASRLGLQSFSQFFTLYASQIAYSIRQNSKDFLLLPPNLLGYRDRRQCAEASFRAFTPTNVLAGGDAAAVAHGWQLFERHCQSLGKSPNQGMRECFADIAGYQIVAWIDDYSAVENYNEVGLVNKIREAARMMVEGANKDTQPPYRDSLSQQADGIVVTILRTFGDQDFSPDGTIVTALKAAGAESAAKTFVQLNKYRKKDDFQVHEPNLPIYYTVTVMRALDWFFQQIREADLPAMTYHVLHQLFADLNHSPLVNEQFRLLNAMSFWLALHTDHLQDATVLRTLINGAVTLMSQSDLARGAQSILEWAFTLLESSSLERGSRIADTLIRLSCAAHDFQLHEDMQLAVLGRELLDWTESQALRLCRKPSLKKQVLNALATWPRELSEPLKSVYEENAISDLSKILNDPHINHNKFRMARRLQDVAADGLYDDSHFATDFWRLRSCIPPSHQLLDQDVDAFCQLLYLQKGRIDGLKSDLTVVESVRAKHILEAQRIARDRSVNWTPAAAPKRAIVIAMLSILDSASTVRIFDAYTTLKPIVTIAASDATDGQNWPIEYIGELELLRQFSLPVIPREVPDLNTLVHSDENIDMAADFPRWIKYLTTMLNDYLGSTDTFYHPLASILQSDVEFAEQILPVLVQSILQLERSRPSTENARPASKIFSEYFTKILAAEATYISCRRVVIDTLLHLRHFHPNDTPDALAYDKWLTLDYILLSRNAVMYGAFTTALLFLELAAEYSDDRQKRPQEVEEIMYSIYDHIDEPDGFYGIQSTDMQRFLLKRLHHENEWEKAFHFHGASFESNQANETASSGVLQSLHAFGFNNLAMRTLQSPDDTEHGTTAMTYQLGWRTETWDLPESTEQCDSGLSLYVALRAVHRTRDSEMAHSTIRAALRDEMLRLRSLGTENMKEIHQVVQNLMCLSQVVQWEGNELQQDLRRKSIEHERWARFIEAGDEFEFADLEAIMATRTSLIRFVRRREQREQFGDMVSPFCQDVLDLETRCLLQLSEAARQASHVQVALNAIVSAQSLRSQLQYELSQEYSNILWAKEEPKLAVANMRQLLTSTLPNLSISDTIREARKVELLADLGTWTSEAFLDKPMHIMAEYFNPAAQILDDCRTSTQLDPSTYSAYHKYAIFADRQYHAIAKSPDLIRWKFRVDRKMQEIKMRRDAQNRTASNSARQQLEHTIRQAKKVLDNDQKQYNEHIDMRDTFLIQALEMYARSLEACDTFDDDTPIRICSLWFANFDYDTRDLQNRIGAALARIPSRKFVFLSHQLSARLSKVDGSSRTNQANLQALVRRMCREHPFHSLYQVFCLLSDQRADEASGSSRRQSSRHSAPSQVDRAEAAINIFDQLRNDPSCAQRVRDVEQLCRASVEFAMYRTTKKELPPTLGIRKIENLMVPVLTAHTPVDPTLRYDNFVWIKRYDSAFETMGGINVPKVIVCRGSDAGKYKQLFKGGGDDLRQDAVMEQVFDLVNIVLKKDQETRKRNLSIRGYKVIPLATQAGVIEFVGNTVPLRTWLDRAHGRYRPDDLSKNDFVSQMVQKREEVNHESGPIVALYIELSKRYHPVMRHYFTERHKTPLSWFRLRLNYARSVATTSIVGHILGLGDRHTSNILLDNGSGEVVHIDLGIAFEQGKLLGVPERVPFRLTRDMVDGLGTSGTQGVFQKCAEHTLRVLRDGSEIIMTVLEVFKYDPLHSWTASDVKFKRAQQSAKEGDNVTEEAFRFAVGMDYSGGTADEAADRALSAVAQKLDKSSSVEFTVNELIAEATDIVNLANMYMGWSPMM
ncbi:hypothetical protein K474DRAFT_1706258 [Panus rudis PR-1116 ss-1]|nr:hypothetical protein K474DRAFT_1706258 [Panus rudis PR-1116 ss-1]